MNIIMPPTLKKWGTYWFRLVHVCVCVRMGHRDIVLKLYVWIPHGKIADAYFWFSLNYLPLLNYSPLTNKMNRIFDEKMIFFELLPFFKIIFRYEISS